MSIPHQFADRIIGDALRHPHNLRDLLELVLGEATSGFDFDRVTYDEHPLDLPDLRHRSTDVLCHTTFRSPTGSIPMWIWILLEHQSNPDHAMPFRMLEYAVWKWRQLWEAGPKTRNDKLPAILPIVLYTGSKRWTTNQNLDQLIESPPGLPPLAPHWPILYLNLMDHSAKDLLASSRAWHQALAIVRAEREGEVADYRQVVGAAAHSIDALADTDKLRHRQLLEFMLRWVAARRPDDEREPLYRAIVTQVRLEHRKRILEMSNEIRMTFEEASEHRAQQRYELGVAEGKAEGKAEGLEACRSLLGTLLEKRFGALPDDLRCRIEDSNDIDRLRAGCEQVSDISSPGELTL